MARFGADSTRTRRSSSWWDSPEKRWSSPAIEHGDSPMLRTRIAWPVIVALTLAEAGTADLRASTADAPPASASAAALPGPFPGQPAFKHRGFYFHCGWAFDHPFAPHSWSRADFRNAFELLRHMGFDTVMYWPQIEGIPSPISADDAAVLKDIHGIIADARTAGLRCWLTLTPNLTSPPEIAT